MSKPKPEFFLASKEFNIRLDKTLFIGDDVRDCEAAYNAGLKSVFLEKNYLLKNLSENQKPLYYSMKLSNDSDIIDYFK